MLERIINASLKDYLGYFADYRSDDSDYFVKTALRSGGRVYILLQQKEPAGYLVLRNNFDNQLVSYAFTVPEKRHKGNFTKLLKHALKHQRTPLRVNITDGTAAFPIVQRVCRRLKFVQGETITIYRGHMAEAYPRLQEFLEAKGNRMLELLQRCGITTCSLAAASLEQREYLRNSAENEFKNTLPVKHFLDDPQRRVNYELSFLALCNGVLVAYVLVTSPDAKTTIFEQLSTAASAMSTGIILAPFVASIAAGHAAGIDRVRYAMFAQDANANSFRKKIIDCMGLTPVNSYMYLKY